MEEEVEAIAVMERMEVVEVEATKDKVMEKVIAQLKGMEEVEDMVGEAEERRPELETRKKAVEVEPLVEMLMK